jgi:hypothetical protein
MWYWQDRPTRIADVAWVRICGNSDDDALLKTEAVVSARMRHRRMVVRWGLDFFDDISALQWCRKST